ncbi:MAG TPA: hypothetical protein VGW58_14990, partial [Pyrinomonadaceae bacterium]|nr:hypothetical protein [Pyrinomonadaceae bacterium]
MLPREVDVVNHIAVVPSHVDTALVRPNLLRITVAVASLILGVFIGSPHRHTQRKQVVLPVAKVIPAATPAAIPELPIEEEAEYPDSLGTNPFDIIKFIRDHPSGKLQKLWKRLGIRDARGDSEVNFNYSCGYCEANTFEYNLDDDAERELVLQIKDYLATGSYRYLVFKDCWSGESKFLGNIDVWAKYRPADPVLLMSGGRSWLIVQSTAATGTGLGAWLDTVYQVSNGRVKPVATYLARVNQSGFYPLPSKVFVGSPVSCEIKHRHVILTVSYRVEYGDYSSDKVPLFTRQQTAVLRGSLKNGSAYLDVGTS